MVLVKPSHDQSVYPQEYPTGLASFAYGPDIRVASPPIVFDLFSSSPTLRRLHQPAQYPSHFEVLKREGHAFEN